ncbi:MAG TPA: FecR domain-containing protein [Burkholderiales bacterium]|jgi:hypothetical protein|nr:FecR domain-containing protein [Burkholderiales bacterium]
MHTSLRFSQALLVLAPLLAAGGLALPLNAQAADQPEKAGTMKIVRGDVRVTDARGERVLQPGDTVTEADHVSTGTDGAASMVMRDGTTMMLGPRSLVDLKTFNFNSTTEQGSLVVSVLRGSLRMISGLIAHNNPQAVAVTTRTATIGVRGTDFIVEVDDEAKQQ